MNQLRLHKISDNCFDQAWEVYEDAFPLDERRSLDAQIHVMKKSEYHFDIMTEDNKLIGFLLWWDFETLRYIDHFAIVTEQRNKGFGKLILEDFMDCNDKPILLEVEIPDSNINERRTKFYERCGFQLNEHYYEVPPSREGQKPLQLLLMTYPMLISAKDVEQFMTLCHPVLFNEP